MWNDEIKNYKIAKIAAIKQELRSNPSLLDMGEDEDEFIPVIKVKKSTKEKKEKKSTYEQTLELLHEGHSPEEIARIRQFSASTINSHFVTLIKAEKLELDEVMELERIRELEDLIGEYDNISLGPLKEKLGDKVTYDELRLLQAAKMR
jgi:uncharacterized protein YpbB